MSDRSSRECIKVAVRLRPLSKKERERPASSIIDIDQEKATAMITNPRKETMAFTCDFAFPEHCTQEEIYGTAAAQIVDAVLEGYNGTIFAFGQPESGKSYTMDGAAEGDDRGIVPRAFEHIFAHIASHEDTHRFSVTMQYIELFNDQIRDLFATKEARLWIQGDLKTGFSVKGAETRTVKTLDDLFRFREEGNARRMVRLTAMNEVSSRSHSILTLNVETLAMLEGMDGPHVRSGKLSLISLAGMERASMTAGTDRQGFKEAASLAASQMAFGNCVAALTNRGRKHIPYRDSFLTRLLRDTLGGNAKALMIATLGPADYDFAESMSTLRYAECVRKIENQPKVNLDLRSTMHVIGASSGQNE